MMKAYDVMHISGQPDWTVIPAVPMEQHLWSDVRSIRPQAQVVWNEKALYVRLSVKEQDILRRFTGPVDPICEDSCLEFFFSPTGSDRYFNFEFNPNGAVYAGYGLPGEMRYRLYEEYLAEQLQIKPFDLPDGWGVEFQVPVSFVQIFVPDFQLSSGQILPANFYKCGDETPQPHFIAWNPVESPFPCFHLPQYFGELHLV